MKDLLSVKQLNKQQVMDIFNIAKDYKTRYKAGERKFTDLKGYSILLPFFENSTRTRTSFELAGKILGADTINISASASSVKKGETLYDTAKTLEALNTDFIVIRHYMSGAPFLIAKEVKSHVINAGDGTNEHPSQAFLDAFTILEKKGKIEGLKIAIIGDILHSRVARSDSILFKKFGATVIFCAPITMLPRHTEGLTADYITTNIEEALSECDVAIFLRIQLERQEKPYFSTLNEYSAKYGLNKERLKIMKKDALIMHPGPVNRGVEIQSEIVYSNQSIILDQVENGLFVRMAIYKYLLNV
ncbi:aspartate carbamoyltransferase catalytic subunit [Venenivibrio stagnispumantis]|uniref:Aspartate carbamoyltransferase n=1 Tax=Venenivibrio stagnispumantis TaxID=407998 RepID=A0AA45WLY0_9AQUI|nr:aspartate carbamoyltransferase catalytic subunit [Venenivibrio stagnispumantis]MCW4572883.1 aspartate carbamoyltransferase catalytic subunit [Venenivibrio stagnispumantis]SMP12891.1 aspartate carbamoyltransferase [Venenivibrio stagnispumantis]